MNKQEANLRAENEQLMEVLKNRTEQLTADNRVLKNQTDLMMVEIEILENQTKHLNRQKDDLNWTLGVILTFENFPVMDFCPDKSKYIIKSFNNIILHKKHPNVISRMVNSVLSTFFKVYFK